MITFFVTPMLPKISDLIVASTVESGRLNDMPQKLSQLNDKTNGLSVVCDARPASLVRRSLTGFEGRVRGTVS
jgi:hypothetical protein